MPDQERLLLSCARIDTLAPGHAVTVTSDHVRVKVEESGRVSPDCVRTLHVEPVCPEPMRRAADFERETFERYMPMLAKRLNAIHDCNESDLFWTSVIGTTLLTHISACRRVYAIRAAAKTGTYRMERLAEESFRIPETETGHVDHFVYSELGDEQLFSILTRGEDPPLPTFRADGDWTNFGARQSTVARYARRARQVSAVGARHPSIFWHHARVKFQRRRGRPTMLVFHCFWSRATKLRMQVRSGGRMAIDDRPLRYSKAPGEPRSAQRAQLSACPPNATGFDAFAFAALHWAAPTSWIENFKARRAAAEARLDEWPTVRFVANESQDEDSSLLLAIARTRGIERLYCEHNYLQYQFIGNLVWLLSRKADRYLSLGWSSCEFPQVEPAGSLFGWTEPRRSRPDIDLLFVAGVAVVRGPTTMSGYGDAGDNAPAYFATTGAFLDRLSDATRRRMYYRDYPMDRRAVLGLHARERTFLDRYVGSFATLDRMGHESTASLISRSKLVVINYLSTAYNEALVADVPTIVLYNADTYHLRAEMREFYDGLIEVGIFQTSPEAAAAFVEGIIDDPGAWWHSDRVRAARNRHVSQNFAGREPLERRLLAIAAAGDEC